MTVFDRTQERLRVLAKATQAFSEASRSPERVFEAVVHEIAEALQCACTLNLVSADGEHLTTPHVHASDPDFLARLRAHLAAGGPRLIAAYPAMKHAVETRTPFFVPHVADDLDNVAAQASPEVLQFARAARLKSALVTPLIVHGLVIGTLGMSRYGEQPAFDEHDLTLIQTLGEHAALALTTASLLEASERELAERERMAARLRLLADASQEFSEATGDYARLLEVVARRLGEIIGDLCAIRAMSEDGTQLEAGAVHHRDPELRAWAQRLLTDRPQRIGEGAMGRVAATRQLTFIPKISPADWAASTSPQYREILERLNVGSVIIAPMLCRGEVIGVAALLRSGPDNPYTESDLHLVCNIADHAGLAIANARLYAAEHAAHSAALSANAALHESEEAHRILFEASPVPLIVFDVETLALLAVNDSAISLYGYAYSELRRMKLSDLRADADDHGMRANLVSHGDTELRGSAQHRCKDGSTFYVEYASRELRFGSRRARIAVMTDVTARHEAEEMRALLAAIVQSANDAIVSKRLDGTITSWNRAAERLFGYSAEAIVGQSVLVMVPPDRLDEEQSLLARLSAGERVDHYETIRRHKDGHSIVVSISLAPIFDASGVVVGVSMTTRDLTEQRKGEQALRNAEDQLRQAQKMEAVGRLAGGIAHDFNNLLSVILSYGEVVMDDMSPHDPARGDLEEIRKAACRAADLTRQLLLFSRQQVIARKVLDLNEVLAGVDKMVKRIVGEDIDLATIPAVGLGRVLADPSSIEQVIMNLVVNARDAMPTGGKLTIETSNVELDADYAFGHLGATPGPHVMLAVSDTGVGMDPATQARIFEPFFTTKETGKGTGLGLSTVFGIVQQSGGSVWVYSEPGRGTTFKMFFPRVEASVSVASATEVAAVRRGSETILLVEDQDQVRAAAHTILKRNGYRVITANNAGEALLLCERHEGRIDLLLTDVVMPHMSGTELAKRLAQARPDLKVLYMSGYTDDSIVRHGVLESEMAFLEKPFTPESLTRKIREVINA